MIPYTLTGKKMEVPVRKLLLGMAPEKAANRDAMARPEALDYFRRSLAIREKLDNADVGEPQYHLAQLAQIEGRYPEAEAHMRSAVANVAMSPAFAETDASS